MSRVLTTLSATGQVFEQAPFDTAQFKSGYVAYTGSPSWATTRGATTGTGNDWVPILTYSSLSGGNYGNGRGLIRFTLPDPLGDVKRAILRLYCDQNTDNDGGAKVGVTEFTGSNGANLNQYGSIADTDFVTRLDVNDMTLNGFNDFEFNAAGIAYLEGQGSGGAAWIWMRSNYDIDNSAPPDAGSMNVQFHGRNEANPPQLLIEHVR